MTFLPNVGHDGCQGLQSLVAGELSSWVFGYVWISKDENSWMFGGPQSAFITILYLLKSIKKKVNPKMF